MPRPLTKSERAKHLRRKLIRALGGRCANPDKNPRCTPRSKLEVDHVDGRTWSAREKSSHTRANRYWAEFKAGIRLRVLCRSCNGGHFPVRDGSFYIDTEAPDRATLEEAPF